MHPEVLILAEIRARELLREADRDRLVAELPPAPRTVWRSAAARYLRAIADTLEPGLEPTPSSEFMRI